MLYIVYTLPNGARLRMLNINSIGEMRQDASFNWVVPVLYKGTNKWTDYIIGQGVNLPPEKKEAIKYYYYEFIRAWEALIYDQYAKQNHTATNRQNTTQYRNAPENTNGIT